VLEYQQTRPQVSVLAFLGGFIIAIAIASLLLCAGGAGERTAGPRGGWFLLEWS